MTRRRTERKQKQVRKKRRRYFRELNLILAWLANHPVLVILGLVASLLSLFGITIPRSSLLIFQNWLINHPLITIILSFASGWYLHSLVKSHEVVNDWDYVDQMREGQMPLDTAFDLVVENNAIAIIRSDEAERTLPLSKIPPPRIPPTYRIKVYRPEHPYYRTRRAPQGDFSW